MRKKFLAEVDQSNVLTMNLRRSSSYRIQSDGMNKYHELYFGVVEDDDGIGRQVVICIITCGFVNTQGCLRRCHL